MNPYQTNSSTNYSKSKTQNNSWEKQQIDWVNRKFDEQMRFDKRAATSKKLFNLSVGLSMADWKAIRSNNYYEIKAKIETEYEKKLFLMKRIEIYLSDKN